MSHASLIKQNLPGGVWRVVEFDRRTRRGRVRIGDLASGGFRSVLILDIADFLWEKKNCRKREIKNRWMNKIVRKERLIKKYYIIRFTCLFVLDWGWFLVLCVSAFFACWCFGFIGRHGCQFEFLHVRIGASLTVLFLIGRSELFEI